MKERIKYIEQQMASPDFWADKPKAQKLIKELTELKEEIAGKNKYDKSGATITILAGAGGLDAEDFAQMLHGMYDAYAQNKGWLTYLLHKNENNHGGYRNITFDVKGNGVYGILKQESGVHRLVRLSPFNSKKQRHTSFVMVDIIPIFEKSSEVEIEQNDVRVEFAKSSGPGGQNVNKRETAVRVVHIPTNMSVRVDSERTQMHNRRKAMSILESRLYCKKEEDRKKEASGLSISKSVEVEWGNQIRSYVLHPYKMIKDHRTNIETADTEAVLKDGKLDEFIEAEKGFLADIEREQS